VSLNNLRQEEIEKNEIQKSSRNVGNNVTKLNFHHENYDKWHRE
jgi:hypothetical protein